MSNDNDCQSLSRRDSLVGAHVLKVEKGGLLDKIFELARARHGSVFAGLMWERA
ncbi:hypothetical protein SAMN04489798_5331 [Pseudomonas arsenicoxydans]|uniref:Uncharacterized protein n=1 Tax=Pseudomonas arsenicoxydans TaxID=702115 RepID=A0A1H0RNJ2_9PSED|nr:hypothetical protein SAMN04489798_5331 [Pseudomonas arsenicoxydans]